MIGKAGRFGKVFIYLLQSNYNYCYNNIFEYNSIGLKEFQQADPAKVDTFLAHLERNGVSATLRRSRGKDIDAACGQLAGKNK